MSQKPLLSGHFSKLGISLYEFFSSHNEKSFKNAFPIKLSYLYLQSEDKEMYCFSSISVVCMFITLFYVLILLNMSFEKFSKFSKRPRRQFQRFLRRRKFPDDHFGVFYAVECSPLTVLAFSTMQNASRRPFW